MEEIIRHTLHKKERLCSKTGISDLLSKGRHGNTPGFRYCYLDKTGAECCRVMVSVPKKLFKRAVKRNLLKRRIRESWRKQKHLLASHETDVLITYSTKEILGYEEIYSAVGAIISRLNTDFTNKNRKE